MNITNNVHEPDIHYSTIRIMMDSIRVNTTDSIRVETIHFNFDDMYMKDSSSEKDYAYLFCYLVKHNLEEFDEPIAANLYDMFDRFPHKYLEFVDYLSRLPKHEIKSIKIRLMYYLAREFLVRLDLDRNPMPDFKDFIARFPFLDEPYIEELYDVNELNPYN